MMASLLLPEDQDIPPPLLTPDPRADALASTYQALSDYMARKHQEGVDQGYWAGGGLLEGGHPTLKALGDATDQYAQGLLLGTTSEGGASLRPAIRFGGKLYQGDTHLDALARVPEDVRARAMGDGGNRGYVSDKGKFMDRWRAQDYALRNDLLSPSAPAWAKTSPELIAENLRLPVK